VLIAAAMQWTAPETAFVVTWPLLLGAATAAVLPYAGRVGAALTVAAAALGVAWIAGLLHLLFLGVGQFAPEALAAGALLLPLVLGPVLSPFPLDGGRWRGAPDGGEVAT
jgi:hypothetical protein